MPTPFDTLGMKIDPPRFMSYRQHLVASAIQGLCANHRLMPMTGAVDIAKSADAIADEALRLLDERKKAEMAKWTADNAAQMRTEYPVKLAGIGPSSFEHYNHSKEPADAPPPPDFNSPHERR